MWLMPGDSLAEPNMKLKLALICTLALAAAGQAMACYTVYDRGNRVLYQGTEPPVDMSKPLHETLSRNFPGGSLVFEQGTSCPAVGTAQLPRPGQPLPPNTAVLGAGPSNPAMRPAPAARSREATQGSPMLTDRRTANALRVPYTPLEGNIVVVPPEAAARVMRPTLTVVPGGVTPPARRTTVGASAASATSVMGAGREQVMITELYDPPMTIVQRGANVYVAKP
jgi:hypothetical protein